MPDCKVNIYIETSCRGPAKRRGAAMWLLEFVSKTGIPVTREGIIFLEEGTENLGALMALNEAFSKLTKVCSVRVFTRCGHIVNTVTNGWYSFWILNDWHNKKNKPVTHREEWEQLIGYLDTHYHTFNDDEIHEYKRYMQEKIEKELEKCRNTG